MYMRIRTESEKTLEMKCLLDDQILSTSIPDLPAMRCSKSYIKLWDKTILNKKNAQ